MLEYAVEVVALHRCSGVVRHTAQRPASWGLAWRPLATPACLLRPPLPQLPATCAEAARRAGRFTPRLERRGASHPSQHRGPRRHHAPDPPPPPLAPPPPGSHPAAPPWPAPPN